MYHIEYGEAIYRGSHIIKDVKSFKSFVNVVEQVVKDKTVMLVERDGWVLYYWEDGWIEETLNDREKRILGDEIWK